MGLRAFGAIFLYFQRNAPQANTMFKATAALFALLAICTTTFAQLAPGARIGYTNYLRTGTHVGMLGGQLDYSFDNTWGLRGSLEAGYGTAGTDTYSVLGLNSNLRRVTIEANGKSTVMLLHGALDAKAFAWGDGYQTGGFYGILGMGLTAAQATTSYDITSNLDDVVYINGFPEEGDVAEYFHVAMRGGIGYQFELGKLNAFSELKLNFPVTDQKRDTPLFLRQDVGVWFGIVF